MPEKSPATSRSARVAHQVAEPYRVLLVIRRPDLRCELEKALYAQGMEVTAVAGRGDALPQVARWDLDVVVVDVEEDGALSIIEDIRRVSPDLPVVAAGPAPSPEAVRQVMLSGASDVLLDARDVKGMREAIRRLSGRQEPEPRSTLISRNPRMRAIIEMVHRIAPTDSTVLIQGESGTGKELVANLIHQESRRSSHSFVVVNCGAIPEQLLESQLFGHERGSFTGAVSRHVGLFEIADNGTIFLDEIGELGFDLQVKLLRVLQSREFRRVGGSRVIKVNVRVIAATNRDLKQDVDRGRFRPDLFYRLNVISLALPPLRERLDELPDFIEHFLKRLERERRIVPKEFTPEAIEILRRNAWPGNVRELENAVERLVLLSRSDQVTRDDVREFLSPHDIPAEGPAAPLDADLSLEDVERIHIAGVLERNGWNKMKSARILGINVKTLYNKIKALGITRPPGGPGGG